MSDRHAEKPRGSDTASVALGIRKSCSLGHTFGIFPEACLFNMPWHFSLSMMRPVNGVPNTIHWVGYTLRLTHH